MAFHQQFYLSTVDIAKLLSFPILMPSLKLESQVLESVVTFKIILSTKAENNHNLCLIMMSMCHFCWNLICIIDVGHRLQDGVKLIVNTFIAVYNFFFLKYFAIFIVTMPRYIDYWIFLFISVFPLFWSIQLRCPCL